MIEYSEQLKKRIRQGDWQELTVSTYDKIHEQLTVNDAENAAKLADYVVDEARIIYEFQSQWQRDIRSLLLEKGSSREEIAKADERNAALLKHPDGALFDPCLEWNDFLELILRFKGLTFSSQWAKAHACIDDALNKWTRLKGRHIDFTYSLMSLYVEQFGEEAIPEMYQRLMGPLFEFRYAKFDRNEHDWAEEIVPLLLYVGLESMRASTTHGDGKKNIELIEDDDCWRLIFDPCGSGGRVLRGDSMEGTPSRMDKPYNWKVIENAYDWTDGKKGICIFCNHCQVVMEHMPMDKFGYPLRVVEPPQYPDGFGADRQRCQWTIYKDPRKVPEEIYARAGRKKTLI